MSIRQNGRPRQLDLILERLQAAAGGWVAMPELARAAGKTGVGLAVHSRISDLRKLGYNIPRPKFGRTESGDRMSSYRLVPHDFPAPN